MRSLLVAVVLVFASASLSAQVACNNITGSYDLGPGTDGNSATGSGPWTLTATNTTFSYVNFTPSATFTFAQLQSLAATFTSNSGGSGGGSPRIGVLIDANDDGVIDAGDHELLIYLGNSPSFTDTDAVLNTWSNVNLIGNNDPGRYDTSAFPGGSPAATYSNSGSASALTLAGPHRVLQLTMIEDTFGTFPSRNLTFNGFTLCAQASDLTITKTTTSAAGGAGQTVNFSIVVTNSGTAPTTGTVTVVDNAPPSLTITSMSGTGWSCNVGTATCTRSDPLAPGSSYPAITVSALIGGGPYPNNSATVSGGGESNTSNDTATAPVPIPTVDGRVLLSLIIALGVIGLLAARRL